MISTQPNGYLEAELSDWKDIRTFRILAIDGGLFTFQDYYFHKHKEKPLIVITNPRSVLHQMEHIEPYWRTSRSTHLRALVFSHTPLIYVRAFITKEVRLGPKDPLESFELAHVEGPLWVAKWDPSKYQHGLFYITVVAMVILDSDQCPYRLIVVIFPERSLYERSLSSIFNGQVKASISIFQSTRIANRFQSHRKSRKKI